MKKVIAFDLDDTLAVTKSPITDRMSVLLGDLLERFDVCIISGGNFDQFMQQVVNNLKVNDGKLTRLHIMPTCGTRYFRYNVPEADWKKIYAENIPEEDKKRIEKLLLAAAKQSGFLETKPDGDIVEDRESQITFSGCGQLSSPERKYAWDPDMKKRQAIRDILMPQLIDYEVRIGGTTSIDITKPGIDKAYGMHKLMNVLEIGKEDILFVGDKLEEGGNDYPVKAMGVDTIAVNGWKETALVIEALNKVI